MENTLKRRKEIDFMKEKEEEEEEKKEEQEETLGIFATITQNGKNAPRERPTTLPFHSLDTSAFLDRVSFLFDTVDTRPFCFVNCIPVEKRVACPRTPYSCLMSAYVLFCDRNLFFLLKRFLF